MTTVENSAQEAYNEIKNKVNELYNSYNKFFPKVNSKLIEELFSKNKNPLEQDHLYTIEIIAKEGEILENVRNYIIKNTGQIPWGYENNSHVTANLKINISLLQNLQNFNEVKEIYGSYVGSTSSYSGIHRHRGEDQQKRVVDNTELND